MFTVPSASAFLSFLPLFAMMRVSGRYRPRDAFYQPLQTVRRPIPCRGSSSSRTTGLSRTGISWRKRAACSGRGGYSQNRSPGPTSQRSGTSTTGSSTSTTRARCPAGVGACRGGTPAPASGSRTNRSTPRSNFAARNSPGGPCLLAKAKRGRFASRPRRRNDTCGRVHRVLEGPARHHDLPVLHFQREHLRGRPRLLGEEPEQSDRVALVAVPRHVDARLAGHVADLV